MSFVCTRTVKKHNLPPYLRRQKKSLYANFFQPSSFEHYTLLRSPNYKKGIVCQKCQKADILTSIEAARKFARRGHFSPEPTCIIHTFYGVPTRQKGLLLNQKQSKKHSLPRWLRLQRSVRCANFPQPSHFVHYTPLLRPNYTNGCCLYKKSQKVHFATPIEAALNFARRGHF